MTSPIHERFASAAELWLCDGYNVDIRFLAKRIDGVWIVWSASVGLGPINSKVTNAFLVESGDLCYGQIVYRYSSKAAALSIVHNAIKGEIIVENKTLKVFEGDPTYVSDLVKRDQYYYPLDLHISVDNPHIFSSLELATSDTVVRQCEPPFDGLDDLCRWLGIKAPTEGINKSQINVRVLPPAEIIFEKCLLKNGYFDVFLVAHDKFEVSRLHVAVLPFPRTTISARRQISSQINWAPGDDGLNSGTATIEVGDANSVLTFLTLDEWTIRRQWFNDPRRARNERLIAVRHFDSELKMVSQAIGPTVTNSGRFENGIANLLFILGFEAAVQLETDSPDIIASTPFGRLIIVECTMRIADFGLKLAKLVDRQGSLIEALRVGGHTTPVVPVLVCSLPRERIATQQGLLRASGVSLLTQEGLAAAIARVDHGLSPDEILDELSSEIRRALSRPLRVEELQFGDGKGSHVGPPRLRSTIDARSGMQQTTIIREGETSALGTN